MAIPLPPKQSSLGQTRIRWQEISPGLALIDTQGGSQEARYLSHLLLSSELETLGYRIATLSIPILPDTESFPVERISSRPRFSTWNDVQQKAIRLYKDGQVQLLRNGYTYVVARVIGDHGTYTVEFSRQDPNSRVLTQKHCTCPWNQYNWGTSRDRKKFEGRSCFLPNTLVLMANGLYVPIQEIESDNEVLSHKTRQRVINRWDNSYCGRMISLSKVGYPFSLDMTEDHKVLANISTRNWDTKDMPSSSRSYQVKRAVQNPDNWKMIEVKNLQKGDWTQIAYPLEEENFYWNIAEKLETQNLIISGTRIHQNFIREGHRFNPNEPFVRYKSHCPSYIAPSDDWLTIFALYLAEGNLAQSSKLGDPLSVEWTFNLDEEQTLVKDLEQAIQNLGLGILRRYYGDGHRITVKVANTLLAQVLQYFCGKGSKTKILAPQLMKMPYERQKYFLEIYASGDGHIHSKKFGNFAINTASPILARQLITLGARVYKNPPRCNKSINNPGPLDRARGITREDKKYTIYTVVFDPQYMSKRHLLWPGYFATRISTLEESHYDGPVYDLNIENDHSYAAEHTVVSNCSHILATYYASKIQPLDEDIHPATQYGQQPQQQAFPEQQPGVATWPQEAEPISERYLHQDDPWQNADPLPEQNQPSQMPPFISPSQNLIPMQQQDFSDLAKDWLEELNSQPISVISPQGPYPGNPMQQMNTLSKISATTNFQNGDTIRLNVESMGQTEGREGATDAGQWVDIPKNSMGTVLDFDPTTGFISAIFPLDGSAMTSYHARTYVSASEVSLIQRQPPLNPFIPRAS